MGVVNVTPDSFSDGGRWIDPAQAVAHGLELHAEGARILDIGGESTRPGAEPVDEAEELRRVLPVVEELGRAAPQATVSIDTSKARVAEQAIEAGATYVNDVTALGGDPGMAGVVAAAGCQLCLMHMLGSPRTMQEDPRYGDVVAEVAAFLRERAELAIAAGVAPEQIQLDPGIGFGKTEAHNLELLRRLDEIAAIGFPVVVGLSRKSFLGSITGREDPAARVAASVAGAVLAWERGASVLRVHDVAATVDALKVAAATLAAP
ncbi:MAG: dihydropteroate synthase [Solirubrobacteraceae bacterium]|nr:dihydropteroate synthase [Solirubrobacteraceae bacterium]